MPIYKCKTCSKEFNHKSHFRQHIHKKKSCAFSGNEHKCSKCNKIFSRKYTLSRHKCTNKKKVQNIKCDYCQQELSREDSLKRHLNICSFKIIFEEKMAESNKLLLNKISMLEDEIKLLKNSTININNINNNIHNVYNIIKN